MKTPLQIHIENKSADGGKTNINKKEPHDAAQKSGLYLDILML